MIYLILFLSHYERSLFGYFIFLEKLPFLLAIFCNFIPQKKGMRLFLSYLLFLCALSSFSQENENPEVAAKIKIDSLYREDQFYFSFSLNNL